MKHSSAYAAETRSCFARAGFADGLGTFEKFGLSALEMLGEGAIIDKAGDARKFLFHKAHASAEGFINFSILNIVEPAFTFEQFVHCQNTVGNIGLEVFEVSGKRFRGLAQSHKILALFVRERAVGSCAARESERVVTHAAYEACGFFKLLS